MHQFPVVAFISPPLLLLARLWVGTSKTPMLVLCFSVWLWRGCRRSNEIAVWDFLAHYNDSYYTETCKNCEASGGLCGFAGLGESFSCICRSGANTTTNCSVRGYIICLEWGMEVQDYKGNNSRR